ncbi:hypothetical protein [Pyrolobus fumarii]|uniref:hypothetical protein n=1 Tax=Pyrolobus fumarii TaxID=54252 RepID=UPI001FCAE7DF|nr:hypothetical protein [Pyrolobus fumarii]
MGSVRPVIVPVHNLGAGGNTPPYWRPPPEGLGHHHAMVNAYFLRPHHRKDTHLDPSVTAWVDSGGFLYIRDKTRLLAGRHGAGRGPRSPGEPGEELVEAILRRQEGFGADYAFTLDYPLHGAMDGEVLNRLRVTARNAALAYQLRTRRSMKLLIVLHYRDASELRALLEMLAVELRERAGLRLDEVDGFAVGGLVPHRGNPAYITERLLEARSALPRGAWLHVLGVASPVNIPLLYAAGGDSMDSKTFIIAAAKRLWYTPPEHYLAGRLPARIEARGSRLKPSEYCTCPACTRFDTLDEMRWDTKALALHNLHVTLEAARLAAQDTINMLKRLAKNNPRITRAVEKLVGARH